MKLTEYLKTGKTYIIAEMSGFANRTSFNEQFRSRYKMTPSEYRRAAKA